MYSVLHSYYCSASESQASSKNLLEFCAICTLFIFTVAQEMGTTPVFNYKIRNQSKEWLDVALSYEEDVYPCWACLLTLHRLGSSGKRNVN